MERMKFESDNLVENNVEKIGKLFPNCITESKNENGKLKKAINFDMLKQMLSKDVVEGDEAYEFTWVGKKESIVEAHKPIRKTLRPCKEESVNWDKTENLYIEGDNLDVLKLLQESYLNKVKMIYIDPPYNTGNDFIYRDNRSRSQHEENVAMGMYDEDDNKLFKNTDTNGRFHSDWCTMIYSRLMLARKLLSDDGIIFISIDDNEIDNLLKVCNEIFGKRNMVVNAIVTSAPAGSQSSKDFAIQHSYCVGYKMPNFKTNNLKRSQESLDERYPYCDGKGRYYIERIWKRGVGGRKEDVPSLHFPVYYNPNEDKIYIDDEYEKGKNNTQNIIRIIPYQTVGVLGRWTWSKSKMKNERDYLTVKFTSGEYKLYKKVYEESETGQKPFSIIGPEIGRTELGSLELKRILNNKTFFYPKPIELVKHFIKICTNRDGIVMDFFSGSATTAHAVMQLNAEDGGNRKFIMVQLDEPCDEESETFKAGYKNICEIGKERIRRAGKKIIYENPDKADILDIGFRTFKLDSTNMKDVYYSAGDYTQNLLDSLESNIKPDRTDLDLLFGCLLEWGLPLSMPYKSEVIDGCTVHIYNDGDLIACFDENISDDVIKAIAERKQLHAGFRDSSFKNSPYKINSFEIFKMISPDTKLRVI